MDWTEGGVLRLRDFDSSSMLIAKCQQTKTKSCVEIILVPLCRPWEGTPLKNLGLVRSFADVALDVY